MSITLYKNLFLVDDDAEDQEIFVDAVKEIDNSILCFCLHGGDDALQSFREQKDHLPDIIFLDLNMPKVNGKQLLAELKKIETLRNTPMIMYSTFFGENDIAEIKGLGAAHHLVKPTKFDELRNSLSFILTKKW
jgi:DNA-binding response OmpR family regulator